MKSKVFWLKLSCWVGVVVDAAAALMLMFPDLNSWMTGQGAPPDSEVYRNANVTATALMWGWTFLLAWAAQKPLERHGILAITLIPVLSWLMGNRLFELLSGQADPAKNIPIVMLQICIFALMSFSLWNYHHRSDSED